MQSIPYFKEKSKKVYKLGFKDDFKYFIKIAIPIVSLKFHLAYQLNIFLFYLEKT